jgi:hypothetical protein
MVWGLHKRYTSVLQFIHVQRTDDVQGVANMTSYKIIKGEASTHTGRSIPVWHVIDAVDGYIFDTFGRKCDAQAWINRAVVA